MSLNIDAPTALEQSILESIENKRAFCRKVLAYFKAKNAQSGANAAQAAWSHHRFRALDVTISGVSVTMDFINLVNTGDLELAYYTLDSMVYDDGSQPYHWLTEERILEIKTEIAHYLGWG